MTTEQIDLVDSSGVIQQRGVLKTEAGDYPDLYTQIVIGVIFDTTGRVLVHKRALSKKVNPGDIDHVCGSVLAGETPEEALVRESIEETGIKPSNVRLVTKGINRYNRFRYLFAGQSHDKPRAGSPREVEWVRFISLDELKEKRDSTQLTFVDGFFEETELAKNI